MPESETCQLCVYGELCEVQNHALKIIRIVERNNKKLEEAERIVTFPISNILFRIAAGCKKYEPL